MAISVVTNVASIRSQRNLAKVTLSTSQNIERLSSGLRINRAGDDAARSAISSQMSALQLGLKQADRNANDNISLVQTAEGALNEVGGIVTRMRELAVQSANEGTMDTTERGYLHQEFNLLRSELDRIVNVTEYNGQKLLDGAITGTAGLDFQVGMNNSANDRISMSLANTTSTGLSIDTDSLASATGAQAAITALDTALATINTERATLGATQNRLQMTISNLGNMYENMAASNSRLKDVDVAEESAAFSRNQIISQAATSMLAQANQLPQSALSLIG
ncbi:MAG: flagellin [Myxococcota bacterium]|nr:flagellin [Myxococcota bacterium]